MLRTRIFVKNQASVREAKKQKSSKKASHGGGGQEGEDEEEKEEVKHFSPWRLNETVRFL